MQNARPVGPPCLRAEDERPQGAIDNRCKMRGPLGRPASEPKAMRCALWLALLASVGCGHRTGVVLTVEGDSLGADQLRLTAAFDDGAVTRMIPGSAAGPLTFPTDLFAEFDARPAAVTFS